MKPRALWIAAVLLFGCIVPMHNFAVTIQSHAKNVVHVQAQVTRYQPADGKKPATLEYTFRVGDRDYQGSRQGQFLTEEETIDLWYNPENPFDHIYAAPDAMLKLLVGGFLALGAGLVFAVGTLLKKRRVKPSIRNLEKPNSKGDSDIG